MALPTDVPLKTTSYEGSWIGRVRQLANGWFNEVFDGGADDGFMGEACLVSVEELEALMFNAAHGFLRQALGCLRNVLETLTIAAALAVTNDTAKHTAWRDGTLEIPLRNARQWLGNSQEGRRIDAAAPVPLFGTDENWLKRRYKRLCAYTHGSAGYTKLDFWNSNGPIFVPSELPRIETELRETLAVAYLLLKIGWAGYEPCEGVRQLLSGPTLGWEGYVPLLRAELL